jgi:hypothetical protein
MLSARTQLYGAQIFIAENNHSIAVQSATHTVHRSMKKSSEKSK